jgi:hypothetical protein
MRPTQVLLLLVLPLVAYSHARAAEIRETSSQLCAFALEGAIVAGDYDRLSGLITRSRLDTLNERTTSLCLKSAGGSYVEGLKIAELIYSHGLSTVVANGSECFSACAMVFMAGVHAGDSQSSPTRHISPYRKLSSGAILGFHAPYLSLPDDKYSREQVESATQSMRKAILGLVEFASKETMGGDFIKKSLIAGILGKGPQEVLFVKTIGEAARWDIDIYDAEEQFPKASNIDTIQNICKNFHYSNMDKAVPRNTTFSLKVEQYESKFPPNARILVRDSSTKDTVCEIYPVTMKAIPHVVFLACSYDYWSSKSFGDCREYKSTLLIGRAEFVPAFFTLDPFTLLKRFKN